jgi:hypothetical protein
MRRSSALALAMVLLVAAGMLLAGLRKATVMNPFGGSRDGDWNLTGILGRYRADQSRQFYCS